MSTRRRTFQTDAQPDTTSLSKAEREALIAPYLPATRKRVEAAAPPSSSSPSSSVAALRSSVRSSRSAPPSYDQQALATLLVHKLLFHLIQIFVSVYVRVRQTYHAVHDRALAILYHHHRTPELVRRDVKGLSRLPRHLSVIVDLAEQGSAEAAQQLVGEVAELAAWCACVGIERLSVYERTGALKTQIPSLHDATLATLTSYFPDHTRPDFHINAANRTAYTPSISPTLSPSPDDDVNVGVDVAEEGHDPIEEPAAGDAPGQRRQHLKVTLLSSSDGRDTLVDLTKTIAEMAQKGTLTPEDVTVDLIHSEVEESSGFDDPDILVFMTGSANARRDPVRSRRVGKRRVSGSEADSGVVGLESWNGNGLCLMGYPPWQVRLTEIFQVQDSTGIGYQIFLRALHRYAKAEMRFGR